MIPVLIGAAAVGLAGAALLSDDDKSAQAVTKEKFPVSEDYVMQQLSRAGKKLPGDSSNDETLSAEDFGRDFERIENMLANPQITNYTIKNELESIRIKAKRRGDEKTLNFVEYYREKLRNRKLRTSTASDAIINFCPYCGAKVHNGNARFCRNCGKSLRDY